MIQQKTKLQIFDNSGAKEVKCIKVLGGFKRKTAGIGDIITVSVQKLRLKNRHRSKVLKGSVVKAIIIKTKARYKKKDGSFYKVSTNAGILINKQGLPIGTRVLSAMPKILKKKKFLKHLSLGLGTF